MRTKAMTAVSMALLLPSAVFGQSDGAVCTALLEHGLSNVVTYTSEYDYLSVIKDNYCSESFSAQSKSRQDSFSLSIKKLPVEYRGGSTRASEQHEYFCREYGNFEARKGQSGYNANTLYDKAIDAWRDCATLAVGGTEIKPSVTPTFRTVDFTLSVSKGQALFTGVETTNMDCTMDGQSVGQSAAVELSSVARSLRCNRTAMPLEFNSSTVQFFPAANVKVKASTGDYRVDLYEMIDGPASDRIARLEAEIAALRAAATATAAELSAMGMSRDGETYPVTNPRMQNKMAACPPGTFVSSIVASKAVGGKYGWDGISELTVRCSPLTNK